MEIDVKFPPKKTRPLLGRLIHIGRAKFKTSFLVEERRKNRNGV